MICVNMNNMSVHKNLPIAYLQRVFFMYTNARVGLYLALGSTVSFLFVR